MDTATRYHVASMEMLDLLEVDPSTNPLQAMIPVLRFDPQDGSILLTTTYHLSGTPEAICHRRILEFGLIEPVDARALTNAINAGEFDALLDRIRVGHAVVWDGSNHVGRLTEDAQSARWELEEQLQSEWLQLSEGGGLWDANEWLEPIRDDLREEISAQTTNAELEAIAERLEAEAHDEQVVVGGLMSYLEGLRNEARERVEEE